MNFRIQSLSMAPFIHLFGANEETLRDIGALRMTADVPHAAPCRVSLMDALPGERLLLVNHCHLDASLSPYRATGPIFVRETAIRATPNVGEIPDMLGRRLLSARVYDADWMMTDADVVEGIDISNRLGRWFDDPSTAHVQLHTARRGCFMAQADRA